MASDLETLIESVERRIIQALNLLLSVNQITLDEIEAISAQVLDTIDQSTNTQQLTDSVVKLMVQFPSLEKPLAPTVKLLNSMEEFK